eukprot:PhF_6_TR12625/c0_g1_i1/m.19969
MVGRCTATAKRNPFGQRVFGSKYSPNTVSKRNVSVVLRINCAIHSIARSSAATTNHSCGLLWFCAGHRRNSATTSTTYSVNSMLCYPQCFTTSKQCEQQHHR